MRKEFTASAYILHKQQVLLIFHKKLQKWLPPGGHLEPNELPSEAAIREAKEETGIEITLSPKEFFVFKDWKGESFPRPHMCVLWNFPETAGEPAHQHIDFIYEAKPVKNQENANKYGSRWFSLKDVDVLASQKLIFKETLQTIQLFLKTA